MSAQPASGGRTPDSPDWRIPYAAPPEGTTCERLINKPRKEVCGKPATSYLTVQDRLVGPSRVPLCADCFETSNYRGARDRHRS